MNTYINTLILSIANSGAKSFAFATPTAQRMGPTLCGEGEGRARGIARQSLLLRRSRRCVSPSARRSSRRHGFRPHHWCLSFATMTSTRQSLSQARCSDRRCHCGARRRSATM